MSDIVWSVSPQHDTLESLSLRIRLHTGDICKAAGIKHDVDIDTGDGRTAVSEDIRRNIFLVFKEAISNAAQHSGATLVRVTAKMVSGAYELTVGDNGRGLPPQPVGPTKRGHGLRNMEHRAKEIGADFSIVSSEGQGTTIRLTKRMT